MQFFVISYCGFIFLIRVLVPKTSVLFLSSQILSHLISKSVLHLCCNAEHLLKVKLFGRGNVCVVDKYC